MSETSLALMVLERAERYGSKRALLSKRERHWEEISWQTLGTTITRAAQGLAALGFRVGDRLAILAENRPEWPIIDLACLTITDRKKDLIVTSDGENVAPQYIEGLLKQDPLIDEASAIGDKRPYLTVLLVPNRPLLESLARQHGIAEAWPAFLERPEFHALFRRRLDEANQKLSLPARVRNFALLDEPFSQERGELTPTLKVKRRTVVETRRLRIEALYPTSGDHIHAHA